MRRTLGVIATLAALVASNAVAQVQGVDLNGRYQCIASCLGAPSGFAFVTQYGWELNMVNDAGTPSRAWVDYPGRLWIEQSQQHAIYSPDGLTIQFDSGTIWQRVLQPPHPLRSRM